MASADVSIFGNPPTRDPSAPDPSTNQPRDDLDDLFNFGGNAVDNDPQNNTTTQQAPSSRHNLTSTDNLGIDEEIKVRKPRAPIAKLDETRLLSTNGIPKLQKITKDRLKFRGKGHEFSDVERLLSTYQLWLDDLFPKAKFADGLAIIEKLGHKKSIQVHRRQWIDDGKPKLDRGAELDDFVDIDGDDSDAPYNDMVLDETTQGAESTGIGKTSNDNSQPEEDELDMLLAEDAAQNQQNAGSAPAGEQTQPSPFDTLEDDLEIENEMIEEIARRDNYQ